MGRYIHFQLAHSNVSAASGSLPHVADASCESCPTFAYCSTEGNVSALTGGYLLLDQQSGLLSSMTCPAASCVSALDSGLQSRQQCMPAGPRFLSTSSLAVINCCGTGRYPAYDPSAQALLPTEGSNVLCALCLPGHSEVNGRCIPCSGVNWAMVSLLLLLSLLLVYLLHRLPHDFSGSASLTIGAYFAQLSLRFLASEATPQMLSLVNLSLDWDSRSFGSNSDISAELADQPDFYVGVCIAPLSSLGKIEVRLLSPLVALLMLAVVGAVQAATSAAIRMRPSQRSWKVYHLLFVPHSAASDIQRRMAAAEPAAQSSEAADRQADEQRGDAAVAQNSTFLLYQRTLVRVLQLSYSALSMLSLSFFRTQSVGEFGRRLAEYPELDPASAEYRRMVPAMIAVIVVVVCGLPLLLAAFLLRAHRQGELLRVKEMARTGQERRLSARQALLLQLCAMYRPHGSWHAVFILVRRLLLVLALVLVSDASVWIWLTALNFCFLALHLELKPFERRVDNAFETLSLLSLSLQTTLLIAWPPPYMSLPLYIGLCALDIGPVLPMVVYASLDRWHRWRESKPNINISDVNASLLHDDAEQEAAL